MINKVNEIEQQLQDAFNAELTTTAKLLPNPLLSAAFSSELVSKARAYATLKHFETNHKYDGQPYDVHLQMVYDFAVKYIHLLPNNKVASNVLAACWVHDVIEDCRQTYNDVKNELGVTVADIAYSLTNEKGKNRKERANDKYYSGIRNTPYAAFIKICDRLANATYSKQSGSSMIDAYKKENEEFNKQLWSLPVKEMFDELAQCFYGC